jgi:hypothetical protein
MKPIWIILSLVIIISCQSPKKQDSQTSVIAASPVFGNIDAFKKYFDSITLDAKPFNIHHYRWATEDTSFQGLSIAPKIIQQYVDSTIFKTNDDEQYFAIAHIQPIDGFLIRVRTSGVEHMQQLFLLTYAPEKKAFVASTKVASFFGAEGFINRMASWIVPNNDSYKVVMRNSNWSVDVARNIETETDSVRTYIFDDHQFIPKSTIKTSEELKIQFPLID